jgi:hypothetical protein
VRRSLPPTLLVAAVLVGPASAALPVPRTTQAPWSRPVDTLALSRAAGLKAERHEFFAYHVHAHLDVFVGGKRVRVPGGVGIDIADPGVQRGRLPDGSMAYGGIRQCVRRCISPLHTHDDTGILHTESQRSHPNRLGQFFAEWRVRLTRSCIGGYCRRMRVFVNGKRYAGDPRGIKLTDRKEIAIVVGKAPSSIPSRFPG